MMKTPKFEIVVGTYEEFLLGFYFISKQAELVQTFAIHEHSSSIRCVSTSGQYLASGAADDRIIVYDLKLRKEHSMLNHHSSTVNCVRFTNNHSHLISCSTDGELSIVRVGSWQLEKTWPKAHKGFPILDIGIHSSGKLALTIGSDCSLRTWNLVKGRQAYIINLNSKSKDSKSLDKIVWAEDGVRFILAGGKYTEVWSVETGGIIKVIEHDEKICSCIWISNNEIVVGYEDGQIALIEVDSCSKNIQRAHSGRVKALAKYTKWIVSASSAGEIKVWSTGLKELSHYNTGCRITCLTIAESLLKVKEEKDEEVSQVTQLEVTDKLKKKSSVIVEVEDSESDRPSYNVKRKYKQENMMVNKQNITNKGPKNELVEKKQKRRAENNQGENENNQIVKQNKKRKKIASDEISQTDLTTNEKVLELNMKTKLSKNKDKANIQKQTVIKEIGKKKRKNKNKNN